MNDNNRNEKAKKEKRGIFIAFIIIASVVVSGIALIAGKTFYPDNEIMDLIWKAVWLGLLPIMLVLSLWIMAKKGKSGDG